MTVFLLSLLIALIIVVFWPLIFAFLAVLFCLLMACLCWIYEIVTYPFKKKPK